MGHQNLLCKHSPTAQNTFPLKINTGHFLTHASLVIVLSSVYCKIGGTVLSASFVLPLPMAITSRPAAVDEHAIGIGSITLVNSTGSGSLTNAMSL